MAYLGKTPSQAVRSRYYYTASGGETSLSGADGNSNVLTFTDGNYVDVSLNGATLVAGSDYNTTTTNTIGGLTALVASDVVEVIVYDTFSVFGGNMAANLNFKDNVKANFGTGNDLQIFHDGSDSIIRDAGTGSLKFQYGTSDGVVFDSSGNVGISNTTPSSFFDGARNLVVGSGSGNQGMTIFSGTSSIGNIKFADGTGSDAAKSAGGIRYDHSSNFMRFDTNDGTEAMRIDSSGNVGLGGSPSRKLHIIDSGDTYVAIQGGTSSKAGIFFGDSDNHTLSRIRHDNTDNSLQFSTNETERLRIDSSGNVLVGTTSYDGSNFNDTSGGGFVVTSAGKIDMKVNGTVANFNRTSTSDGDILYFAKQGASVGSIGTQNDDLTIGTGDTGLQFRDASDAIRPFNISTNAARDASIDLGRSSERFRSLFLSSGVYLGGTGSANHLDDYEEGTWTPVDGSGASLSFTEGATANYIKIGRLVLFNFYVTYPVTSSTATASIGGLPYAVTSSGYFYANYRAQVLGSNNLVIQLNQGSTVMSLYSSDAGYSNATLSGAYLLASGSYMTS